MEVTLGLLADAANFSSEGKLNVLGAFDTIYAQGTPVRHPEMQLVMRFEASPAEYGMRKRIEIQLVNEDGERLGGAQGELEIPAGQGRRTKLQHVLGLRDVTFPKAGQYAFYILVDGRTEYEVPLQVVEKPNGSTSGGPD
jgi:hypothetical protein